MSKECHSNKCRGARRTLPTTVGTYASTLRPVPALPTRSSRRRQSLAASRLETSSFRSWRLIDSSSSRLPLDRRRSRHRHRRPLRASSIRRRHRAIVFASLHRCRRPQRRYRPRLRAHARLNAPRGLDGDLFAVGAAKAEQRHTRPMPASLGSSSSSFLLSLLAGLMQGAQDLTQTTARRAVALCEGPLPTA